MASFIAEIDSSSRDVASYIAQRLMALAEIDGDAHLVAVLDKIALDARKLERR